MSESEFDTELERRLRLLESQSSDESIRTPLPALDLWCAVIGFAVLTIVMVWWGYPA